MASSRDYVVFVICVLALDGLVAASPADRGPDLQVYNDTSDLPDKWWVDYAREYKRDGYELLVVEANSDKRVANILYATEKMDFYYRHFQIFDNPSGDPGVQKEYESYISGPEVDQTSCKRHLGQMNDLLDEIEQINRYHRLPDSDRSNSSALRFDERHARLARVLDSYGRYASGVLTGRTDVIGFFEQCLETKLHLGPPSGMEVVGTRYCKATVGFHSDLHPAVLDYKDIDLGVAVCLPKTCHSASLEDNRDLIQRLMDSQFSMPESIYVRKHRKIERLFCLNDGSSSPGLPLSGKLFVIAAISWSILLVVATYCAETLTQSPRRSLRMIGQCFDMKLLLYDFIEKDRSTGRGGDAGRLRVNLDALNIVKIICMILVVLCHTIGATGYFDANTIRLYTSFRNDHIITALLCTNLVVDMFFVMSGILFSYIALKKFNAEIKSSKTLAQLSRLAAKLFLGRYLRIVPLFFVAFWFKKSVVLYLNSGPFQDPGFNHETLSASCKRDSWLTPFTSLSAYKPMTSQCLGQSWSLGSEIYFIVLTTPIFILLAKRPKLTMLIAFALGVTSCAVLYDTLYKIDPSDLRSLNSFDGDFFYLIMLKYSLIYTNPRLRLSSVLGGLVGGYFLYRYEAEKRDWPRWFSRYITGLAIAAFVFIQGSLAFIPEYVKYGLHNAGFDFFVHTFVVSRLAWALGTCVLSLRLVTDCQNILPAWIFSGTFGRIMAKINLALLLIHIDIMLRKVTFTRNYSLLFSKTKCFDNFIVIYVYSFVLAVLAHVLIESPIDKLIRSLLQGSNEDRSKKKQS